MIEKVAHRADVCPRTVRWRPPVAAGLFAAALLALQAVVPGMNRIAHGAALDAAASSVSATFRQLGVPVSGKFRQVQGDIEFDAARPAAAKAGISILVASFDLGDKDYNAEVAKKDWFDAGKYPQATFVLKQVAGSSDSLRADGVLTIKGRSLPLQFPVTVRSVAGKATFEGRAPVSRLAFGIGEGEWKDTSLVADEVLIEFRLVAPAAVPAPLSPSGKSGAGSSVSNSSASRADSQESKKDIRK